MSSRHLEAGGDSDPGSGRHRLLAAALQAQLADTVLAAVLATTDPVCPETLLLSADFGHHVRQLLHKARRIGAVRDDVTPDDLRRLLCGVVAAAQAGADPDAAADRYLTLLLAALARRPAETGFVRGRHTSAAGLYRGRHPSDDWPSRGSSRMRAVLPMVAVLMVAGSALRAQSALAAPAAAAPGASACSGTSCLKVSIPQDPARPGNGYVDLVTYLTLTGGPVSTASMTVQLSSGLRLDTNSVVVGPDKVPPSEVVVTGNDITFPVGAFTSANPPYPSFRITIVPGTTTVQRVSADVTFHGGAGAQAATASSTAFAIDPLADLKVTAFNAVRPDGLYGPEIPPGFVSDAWFFVSDTGFTGVPAGSTVLVRASSGFRLVANGVRYAINDDAAQDGGTTLQCTGTTMVETCTGAPAFALGSHKILAVRVSVPDTTPVGTKGTVSVTVVPPALSGVPARTATLPVQSGPVAHLAYAVSFSSASVVVGHTIEITLRVHNSGPQAASGWRTAVDSRYFDNSQHTAIRLQPVEKADVDATRTDFRQVHYNILTLAAGATFTRHITLTGVRVAEHPLVVTHIDTGQGTTFDANCPGTSCPQILTATVRVVPTAALAAPARVDQPAPATTSRSSARPVPTTARSSARPAPTSTGALASTGSNTAQTSLIAALCLALGAGALACGRPNRRPPLRTPSKRGTAER